ncbi:MAG TPA: bifunctional glutamate N-acetyltransferase/amino-acid acetyltransferase ArgJ [Thermoguttaceae bacterium]|nr:bifunctional glutamate N-acetyltransferase/amino-acid acetyltransferase ArgJ [Thermoguttaceae bacterium]
MAIRVPKGFRLAGVHCGLKSDPRKPDLTLVVSDTPAVAAGVYTQNLVYAAPVALDRERTPSARIRTVVVNSGNANACTGDRGLQDARRMARLAADACGAEEDQALVLSTGIIGEYLPMDKIAAGIEAATAQLGSDDAALISAARGMMTTDTVRKLAGRTLSLSRGQVQITGMAKGAGMIGPRMATMLGLVITDAALEPDVAQSQLAAAAGESFNCISIEGHMSTNDTVLLLANGAADPTPLEGEDLAAFRQALGEVCVELARAIPADGEGATHLITIEVTGCATRDAARQVAKTIAESALVKTAVAGGDPNWGRIVSAAGYAGVPFDPAGVSLRVNGFPLYQAGAPVAFDAKAAAESIRQNRETFVELALSEGEAKCRFWTSDLTVDYVRINADYHT